MIPYADFLYFGYLLYPLAAILLLGFAGRAGRLCVIATTVAMIALQYQGALRTGPSSSIRELWIVAGYGLYQWIIAAAFLRARARVQHRSLFWTALALAILPLLVAKFLPQLAPGHAFGFLGISYVTFRSLDVIFLIQDRLIAALPPDAYVTYLLFFPTISSGPIDRYRRFAADYDRPRRTPGEFLHDLDIAVDHVFTGFLYKFLLAALILRHGVEPFAHGFRPLDLIRYMYGYSFYLFFDFAGYSAFAIGLSYLLGIRTPENFNRPFLARNIRDFWDRWHISLSTWFRDHVYMRFVLAATMGRWFKKRYTASTLGFFLAFGLMGLWHGTEWYYLLYGLYHATLLSSFDAWTRWHKGQKRKLWGTGPLWNAAAVVLTFHFVCAGFLLFSGRLAHTARETDRPDASTTDTLESVVPSTVVPGPSAGREARRSAARDSFFEGTLDRADCNGIRGWAWDRRKPFAAVRVTIYDGQIPIATVPADVFRQGLLDNKKGNGAHGFRVPLPPALRDGRAHTIRVRVAETSVELQNSPQDVTCDE